MKKISLSIASLLIVACTTHQSFSVAHQQDRATTVAKPVNITGKVDQVVRNGILGKRVKSKVFIYFDDVLHVTGKLDRQGFGQLPGVSYQDKPVSSTCSSKPTGPETSELSCMVFINSERVATLVMQTKKDR
jgi:hypothetical protein